MSADQASKLRTRAGLTSRSLTADLKALGWHLDWRQSTRLALTLEALIGELAALAEIADANRSVAYDKPRSRGLAHEMPIPNFDPAGAADALVKAEQRLWTEYEKLAGVTRRPSRPAKPKCESCNRRERLVDTVCGPCGARILKEHRRG